MSYARYKQTTMAVLLKLTMIFSAQFAECSNNVINTSNAWDTSLTMGGGIKNQWGVTKFDLFDKGDHKILIVKFPDSLVPPPRPLLQLVICPKG